MMRFKILIDKSYTDPYWRTALHFFFWAFLFTTNYYFTTISFNSFDSSATSYLLAAKNTFILVVFYYPLMYYILPYFFFKKRFLTGSILIILLLLCCSWLDAYGDKEILNSCRKCMEQLSVTNPGYHHFLQLQVSNIMIGRLVSLALIYQLLILLSLPVAIKIGRSYFRQTVQQLQLSKDNLQLEFNFLKSQVSPHFLFNTLNNIYSLVVHDKKQQAATTIARLSGFMRYTLYECNEEKIGLEKEIQLLKDYIELEQLRLNQTSVQFNYQADTNDYKIPPLLFMPAVENAFKYSKDHSADSFITIDICVKDRQLVLRVKNNFDVLKTSSMGGIGLANLQKRLQYYYPGTHSYSVTVYDDIYSLEITCLLS